MENLDKYPMTVELPVKVKHFNAKKYDSPLDCPLATAGQEYFGHPEDHTATEHVGRMFIWDRSKDVLRDTGRSAFNGPNILATYRHETYDSTNYFHDLGRANIEADGEKIIRTVILQRISNLE
jgi:cobyrinic acid a,c-diamide synthase